jgi:hypothetical protein
VAADERSVNGTVYRLLKRFLARSVGLYAILGLAAYMMSGGFWALRIDRIPLVGMWLGLWGGIAAFNARSVVWRSLPIAISDIAQYRWWATVGAPGCFITVITLLSWGVQLSARLPAPSGSDVLQSVVVNWSILALVAACWDEIRYPIGQSKGAAAAKTLLLVALCVLLTCYGLPKKADTLAPVWAFVSVGLMLLMLGVLRARRATDKRWVYASSSGRFTLPWSLHSATTPRLYGLKVLFIPALRYAVVLAALAILGLVTANKLASNRYPHAATIFLFVVLAIHSMLSYVSTDRLRTATQPLRCLPLSVHRLAAMLQIMSVLPGLVAALLTLLTARLVLHLSFNLLVASGFTLTLFGSLGIVNQSQRWQAQLERSQYRGPFVRRWLPLIQSLLVPGWFGFMAAILTNAGFWSSPRPFIGWVCLGMGIFFFALGHYALVRHLRAGIRPSASQTAFSVA